LNLQKTLPTASLCYISGFLIVVTAIVLHQSIFGAYTEIPSDFWEHMARVVSSANLISENQFNTRTGTVTSFLTQTDLAHFLHAIIAHSLQSHPLDVASSATLSLGIVFLGSQYWFTLKLLENTSLSNVARTTTAIIATFLTALSFGTASFSYYRYYAYFPTIFCFPIVYLCVSLALDYLQRPTVSNRTIFVIPIFLLVLSVTHTQEALFTVVLIVGIVIWRTVRTFHKNTEVTSKLFARHLIFSLGIVTCLAFFIVATFMHNDVLSVPNSPHILSINTFLFDHLYIANPTFRFWDTLGYFGLIVYFLYIARWAFYRDMDYINVAMLAPLFTHFNPIYSSTFLHFGTASALWRTSYLMPLSIVSAIFLVKVSVSYLKTRSIKELCFLIIPLILMTLSLLPISYGPFVNRTTKLPSIFSAENHSGAILWQDLILNVSKLNKSTAVRGILTDYVTKFVLDTSVFGNIPKRSDRQYFPAHNKDYQTDISGSDFSDHLLIVNRRNGSPTFSSRFSGHWSPNILQTSSLYPEDIESFLKTDDLKFNLLWKENNISIYRIARR
jgi:hypothetical protein